MATGTIPLQSDLQIKYLGSFGATSTQKTVRIAMERNTFYVLFMLSANVDKDLLAIITNTSGGNTAIDPIRQGSLMTVKNSADIGFADTVEITSGTGYNTLQVFVITSRPGDPTPIMTIQ